MNPEKSKDTSSAPKMILDT